jgi:hypothetical protein
VVRLSSFNILSMHPSSLDLLSLLINLAPLLLIFSNFSMSLPHKRPTRRSQIISKGRKLGHEIQCHKMLYHVNKEKDSHILSTWRAHIRASRLKSISWTPNIRRPQMEYTHIEHHKEGELNNRLPQMCESFSLLT